MTEIGERLQVHRVDSERLSEQIRRLFQPTEIVERAGRDVQHRRISRPRLQHRFQHGQRLTRSAGGQECVGISRQRSG